MAVEAEESMTTIVSPEGGGKSLDIARRGFDDRAALADRGCREVELLDHSAT